VSAENIPTPRMNLALSKYPNPRSVVYMEGQKLERELTIATAKLEKAREVLKGLEWVTGSTVDYYCKVCSNYKYEGHKPDCVLAAALKD